MTLAVAFEVRKLGNTIKTLYHLLNNHHYAANEVGSETSKALKRGATHTTAEVCQLLCSASKGLTIFTIAALARPTPSPDLPHLFLTISAGLNMSLAAQDRKPLLQHI